MIGIYGPESGTWSDVSVSRAFSTIYQNTGGKKRHVSVYLNGAVDDEAGVLIQVSSANPPIPEIAVARISGLPTAGRQHIVGVYAEVPSNHYYRVIRSEGTETLNKWYEWDE